MRFHYGVGPNCLSEAWNPNLIFVPHQVPVWNGTTLSRFVFVSTCSAFILLFRTNQEYWHFCWPSVKTFVLPGDQGKCVAQIFFGTNHIRIFEYFCCQVIKAIVWLKYFLWHNSYKNILILLLPVNKSNCVVLILFVAQIISDYLNIFVARWSRQICDANTFWHNSYKNTFVARWSRQLCGSLSGEELLPGGEWGWRGNSRFPRYLLRTNICWE